MMWFLHDGKPNRLKPWCGCLLHLSILKLSRNGPSHGVKRHLGGKYSKTFFFGEVYASFNRIISGPGMPLQVFIKLFFSLFGLSKYVKQKINSPNNLSSLPQLPRAQHDVEQPSWPDVSLPDCLRPLHVGHNHRLDQPPHCYDVRHLPKDTGPSIFPTMWWDNFTFIALFRYRFHNSLFFFHEIICTSGPIWRWMEVWTVEADQVG